MYFYVEYRLSIRVLQKTVFLIHYIHPNTEERGKEMRSFEEMSFVQVSALQANPTKQALQLNFSPVATKKSDFSRFELC